MGMTRKENSPIISTKNVFVLLLPSKRPIGWLNSRNENFVGIIGLQARKGQSLERVEGALSSKRERAGCVACLTEHVSHRFGRLRGQSIHIYNGGRARVQWVNIYLMYIPCSL